MEFEEHIVDVEIPAFCQDDDVAAMDHQLLDLTHIAGNLLFILQDDLIFFLNYQVLADRSCLSAAENSIPVLPKPNKLNPTVMVLLKSGCNCIFLQVKNSNLTLISSQKGIELSFGVIEKGAINFELKCKISWNFIDIAQQLLVVCTGDTNKAVNTVNNLRRALVDTDCDFFVNFLGSRVIDVSLIVDADQDGVFSGEKIVRSSFAYYRILLGL